MTRKLYHILNALDNKYDIEIEDYFKLSLEDREEIAELIAQSLFNSSHKIPVILHQYLSTLHNMISNMERNEEYEKCDLFSRIQKKLFDTIDT